MLCLRGRNLTTLQGLVLGPGIAALDVSGNRLKDLRGCPEGIINLQCDGNELVSLEGAPSSLLRLDASRNKITSLAHCPPSLAVLVIDDNVLTHLDFPSPPLKLQALYCSRNRLSFLAGLVAPALRELYVNGNRLTTPLSCPPSVVRLELGGNPLLPQYRALKTWEISRHQKARKIQRCWRRYYYRPNWLGFSRFLVRSYDRLLC
jgi:hypothetical protein